MGAENLSSGKAGKVEKRYDGSDQRDVNAHAHCP